MPPAPLPTDPDEPRHDISARDERPIPLVLGVLGGVAAGKSEVARRLAGSAGRVISADQIAHEVLASPEVSELVERRFGREVMGADGRPDRAALAALAFDAGGEAAATRKALEDWTHPRVRARILQRLRDARSDGVPRIILDVPLLLENDAQHRLADQCNALIFVDVGEEERERRARARGWPAGELARREAAQLPLSKKRERADRVVANDGSLSDLDRAIADVLKSLAARETP